MEPEDLISHTEGMRNAARSAHSCRMPFTDLPPGEHRDALIQAVNNVLATALALFTFAQIVDGLPTGEVAWDRRYPGIPVDHIIEDVHEKLCDGAMDKARELSRIWDPSILMFSPKVCLPSRGTKRRDLAVDLSADTKLRPLKSFWELRWARNHLTCG